MRLLLTTDTIGGVWTYTKELTECLLRRGCSVALVSFGRWPSEAQFRWCEQITNRAQACFNFVPSDIPLEWMSDNSSVVEDGSNLLQSVAQDFNPDLYHLNQFCFGRLSVDVPKLLVAHSDVLSWAKTCVPGGLEPSSWLVRYVDMVQEGLKGACALVAPTSFMMQQLGDAFLLPASCRVIANGRTLPVSECLSGGTLQAVTAGRMWDPSKNLAILKQIQTFPLMVAGDSGDEPSMSVRSSNISYLGYLTEPELHNLFRRSHIYIAASVYEPFGLAPLEAALCGCAVLANDIPSFREVWGSSALYFTTPSQLQQRLEEFSLNATLLGEMQMRALRKARQYSAETMTTRYLALYNELLSGIKQSA